MFSRRHLHISVVWKGCMTSTTPHIAWGYSDIGELFKQDSLQPLFGLPLSSLPSATSAHPFHHFKTRPFCCTTPESAGTDQVLASSTSHADSDTLPTTYLLLKSCNLL